MKWGELSLADLIAVYNHATIYTSAAQFSKQVNGGGIGLLSEKDKAWHTHWKGVQLKAARQIFEMTKALDEAI